MTHPTPSNAPRPEDPAAGGSAPTDADVRLMAQLDAVLAPAAPPAGLADAVLAATRDRLPVGSGGDAPRGVQLDAALASAAAPAGLTDAVLAATRDLLPAGVGDSAPLQARLDAALGPAAAPAGLADAVLNATRDHLPAAAPDPFGDVAPVHFADVVPVGRIGFGRAGWMRALAAAALVALAAGAWWLGPAGGGPAAPAVVTTDTPETTSTPDPPVQTATVDSADLDADAARLLEPFEAIDSRLARAVPAGEAATDPVGLLGQRLTAVADAGPWSGSGFDGIDRAIDWEVSYETADDGAWLF